MNNREKNFERPEKVDKIDDINSEKHKEIEGILEIADGGFGFLRFDNFLTSEDDVYVANSQIRRFNLKTGDKVRGIAREPRREFDTCKMAPKSEHIEIKPLSANFFVKFYVFLRACL